METIWKFKLTLCDEQSLSAPKGAEFLSVNVQHDRIAVWAKNKTSEGLEKREFRIFGTGHRIPSDYSGRFLGTVLIKTLVFHVYVDR